MKYLFLLLFIPNFAISQGSGNTINFNGINEAVDLGNTVANNCRTIELWFKPQKTITSSINEPKTLIARDFNNGDGASTNEFGLCFIPSSWGEGGKILFFRRIGSLQHNIYSDADHWIEDHWYHVAISIDPINGMIMYINGVKQESSNSSTAPIGTQIGGQTDNVSLAKWGNLNIRHFEGEIDEVRLWETSRTQAEIQQKLCSKLEGNESGLKAYYNFNSQNSSTLLDITLNNNNGTLVEMDESNRFVSGAPIGDTSIFIYDVLDLTGQSLSLSETPNNYLAVNSINSTSKGIHIYRVNSFPNSLLNLSNPLTNDYYGVFLTDINGTFNIDYNFTNFSCVCPNILSRNDNSIIPWTILNGSNNNCSIQLDNQSTIGYDYRAEFIIDDGRLLLNLGNDTTFCQGDTMILDAGNPGATYLWQDNSENQILNVTQEGIYWVTVNYNGCTAIDSINITLNPSPSVELGNDTAICKGEIINLDAGNPGATYLWQDNSENQILSATEDGIYWVTVSNNGCTAIDSISIIVDLPINVDLGNDTTICAGETLYLDAGNSEATFLWQDNSNNQILSVNQDGIYWVAAIHHSCFTIDSINITVATPPNVALGNDITICEGETIYLDANNPDATFLWQDNSENQILSVNQDGIYWVVVNNNGCTAIDSISIIVDLPINVELGNDITICQDETLNLDAGNSGASYLWQDNSEDQILTVSQEGVYSVTVTNECGIDSSTIYLQIDDCQCHIYLPNIFSPNFDGTNDAFLVQHTCDFELYELLIYSRWGELIFKSNDPMENWDGTYKGVRALTDVYVYKLQYTQKGEKYEQLYGNVTLVR